MSSRPPLLRYERDYGFVGVVLTAVIDALLLVAAGLVLFR